MMVPVRAPLLKAFNWVKNIFFIKNIVFLGNMRNLDTFFEEKDSATLRGYILDEMHKELAESEAKFSPMRSALN